MFTVRKFISKSCKIGKDFFSLGSALASISSLSQQSVGRGNDFPPLRRCSIGADETDLALLPL